MSDPQTDLLVRAESSSDEGAIVATTPTPPAPAPIARATPREVFQPSTLEEAKWLASTLIKSRMAPPGLDSPEAVFVAMALGADLGLSPMQAVRSIHVIKGKPTISADGMLALVRASGLCAAWTLEEFTAEAVTIITQRTDDESRTAVRWSLEDARRAGLGGDNWKRYPRSMLRARATSELCRAVYPEVVSGLYSPEEITEPAGTVDARPDASAAARYQ